MGVKWKRGAEFRGKASYIAYFHCMLRAVSIQTNLYISNSEVVSMSRKTLSLRKLPRGEQEGTCNRNVMCEV